MKHLILVFTAFMLIFQLGQLTNALPIRMKRSGISDQRLAELETLIALSNMRGRLRNTQVAYGVIDPDKIGKRKRSYDDDEDDRRLDENHLQRIMKSLLASQEKDDVNSRA